VDSLVTPEALLNNPTVVEHREKEEGFGDYMTYAFFTSPTTFRVDAKDPNEADAATIASTMSPGQSRTPCSSTPCPRCRSGPIRGGDNRAVRRG
jgi:hypothetical protein